MQKLKFLLFIALFSNLCWSQTIDLELIKEFNFKEEINNWTIDNIGNLIVQQGNTITKIDSSGKQTFTQSIKSLGEISQISAINSMKIVLFSSEQQSICLLDNTLTINGQCKYMDQYDISFAKFIAVSNRPNLVWIYDQLNSSILLIDLIQDKIIQKIENFAGIASIKSELIGMEEHQNKLYLYDSVQIYEFDLMLNWSNTFTKTASKFSFSKDNIIGLNNQTMTFTSISSNENNKLSSKTLSEFQDFRVSGTDFYFSGEKKISKFKLISSKN
jgi:hypothetical protein